MKKFRVLQAILVLFSALAVTSCGDEPTLPPLGPNGTNGSSLRVSMGSEEFEADEVTANVAGGAITVTGIRGENGELLILTLNQTALALDTPYDNVSFTYMESAAGDEYVSVNNETGFATGTIVVTELDIANRTITGNFAFTGYNLDEPTASTIPFFSGTFSNVYYTGDALPAAVPPVVIPVEQYLNAVVGDETEATEFQLPTATPTSGKLTLQGVIQEPLSTIKLIVDETIEAGTYEFAASPVDGPYATYQDAGVVYESTGGTLTIISNGEGYIKGTFSFAAADGDGNVVEFTEGEFNIAVGE